MEHSGLPQVYLPPIENSLFNSASNLCQQDIKIEPSDMAEYNMPSLPTSQPLPHPQSLSNPDIRRTLPAPPSSSTHAPSLTSMLDSPGGNMRLPGPASFMLNNTSTSGNSPRSSVPPTFDTAALTRTLLQQAEIYRLKELTKLKDLSSYPPGSGLGSQPQGLLGLGGGSGGGGGLPTGPSQGSGSGLGHVVGPPGTGGLGGAGPGLSSAHSSGGGLGGPSPIPSSSVSMESSSHRGLPVVPGTPTSSHAGMRDNTQHSPHVSGGIGSNSQPNLPTRKTQGTSGMHGYPCEICQKAFRHRTSLEAHLRTHSGDRPFGCTQCDKHFSQKSALATHLKLHSGIKPHKCVICDKCFALENYLKLHMRTHTGERPYVCDVCSRSFTQRNALRIHERTHTGERPFSCAECGKAFIHKGNLRVHERVHTREKPYTCSVCLKTFAQSSSMTTHMKNSHQILGPRARLELSTAPKPQIQMAGPPDISLTTTSR